MLAVSTVVLSAEGSCEAVPWRLGLDDRDEEGLFEVGNKIKNGSLDHDTHYVVELQSSCRGPDRSPNAFSLA